LQSQHIVKALDDIPGLDKVRQLLLDCGNRHRLSLGQIVAFKGHQAGDGACARRVAEPVLSLFGPPSSCCPFRDNTETSAKPSQSKLPPQFSAVS
jgi:hypothetical protein